MLLPPYDRLPDLVCRTCTRAPIVAARGPTTGSTERTGIRCQADLTLRGSSACFRCKPREHVAQGKFSVTTTKMCDRVARWSLRVAPPWLTLSVGALLGVMLAVRVFGVGYLSGSSEFWSWPVGDAAMMRTGWEYYSKEPWHWPLGHTSGTGGLLGTNILYLDAIPLVAFVAKLLRTVFGGRWHPYGFWHLAIYALQGMFGALLARQVGLRSVLGGVAVAMLNLSLYAFVLRFYHEGLNAHFVLLWAFSLYLRTTPTRRTSSIAAEWTACIACSLLLHPYLAAMSTLLAAASLVRLRFRQAVEAIAVVGVGLAVVAYSFGYFPRRLPSSPGDFGRASLNLMSLAVPYYSRLFPTSSLPQDATGLQWDGCNYLGVGVWILVLLALVSAPRECWRLIRQHKAMTTALLLLAAYAPSNQCWLGEYLVWEYPMPDALRGLFENARATGRFFWPVTYALGIASSGIMVRRFPRYGVVIVALTASIQMVDSSAYWPIVTNALARPAKRHLDWNVWSLALAGAARVNMYPSYQCWGRLEVPGRILEQEREIEYLAAISGARTNGGRAARPIVDCGAELEERERLTREGLRDSEVYVFFRPAYLREVLAVFGEEHCLEIADAFVCRRARVTTESGDRELDGRIERTQIIGGARE